MIHKSLVKTQMHKNLNPTTSKRPKTQHKKLLGIVVVVERAAQPAKKKSGGGSSPSLNTAS